MILEDLSTVPVTALPIAAFARHLHLWTGFADDGSQDAVLETYLRAAIGAIEARIGKILITRSLSWSVTVWRDAAAQALPVAPLQAIDALQLVDRSGGVSVVPTDQYDLEKDSQRPRLVAVSGTLPPIPPGGSAEILFQAGYGATWAEVPVDLAQAVFMLAAHYYENRAAAGNSEDLMPFGVLALIETHRTVRILGGRR